MLVLYIQTIFTTSTVMSPERYSNTGKNYYWLTLPVLSQTQEQNASQHFAQVVIRKLLFVAENVDLNTGPISSESLMAALATLGQAAPIGPIKNIVETWSIDEDVCTNFQKFIVDEV